MIFPIRKNGNKDSRLVKININSTALFCAVFDCLQIRKNQNFPFLLDFKVALLTRAIPALCNFTF